MSLELRLRALAADIGGRLKAVAPRLLPSGGKAGQVLVKATADDYAVAWADEYPRVMGLATIGQANAVIASGTVVLTANVAGVKVGDALIFVPTVCPVDRLTGQCRCDADGVVKIWVNGPGLTLLTSYTITGRVFKLVP